MKAELQLYSERGVLIGGLSASARVVLVDRLDREPPLGLVEYVHGYDNMLLLFTYGVGVSDLADWLEAIPEEPLREHPGGRLIEVPVLYTGADLASVARQTGLSEEEVVAIHTAPEYRVRMMGFSPGFPYLDGLDPRLHLERRHSPRDRIEPGSVAIGGSHAGIYSVASPGGWHILGQTDQVLFRPELAKGAEVVPLEVFAFVPGDRVKFIATE